MTFSFTLLNTEFVYSVLFVKTINQEKEGEKRSAREIFEQNILFSGLSIEYEYKNVNKKNTFFMLGAVQK